MSDISYLVARAYAEVDEKNDLSSLLGELLNSILAHGSSSISKR